MKDHGHQQKLLENQKIAAEMLKRLKEEKAMHLQAEQRWVLQI
jgi:hypothetical protein